MLSWNIKYENTRKYSNPFLFLHMWLSLSCLLLLNDTNFILIMGLHLLHTFSKHYSTGRLYGWMISLSQDIFISRTQNRKTWGNIHVPSRTKTVISQDFIGRWNMKPNFIVSYYVRNDRALLISLWYMTLHRTQEISFHSFKLSLHIFSFVHDVRYYLGHQIKKKKIGASCGTYTEEMCVQSFDGETWAKQTTCKTLVQMAG